MPQPLAIAGGAALIFGMAPAVYTVRRDRLATAVRGAGKVAGGRGQLRNALVAAEIALSLVLVLGAGLLMRTFVSIMRVDLGFEPARLAVVSVAFPPGGYSTAAERQRFYDESLRRIRSVPGVDAVAATTGIPPFELIASFATNRLLATQLWSVSPADPVTLAAATVLVSLIALAASYIPARRALRVDPIVALRED